ncbi:MAG: 1-deoxy-D-xylulose-5-phosphate synthase [Bacilli bacterium]|nr:1-deoxy-D-xylulose-5-phosphate synthase [Bacilli bacterium]
MSDKIREIDINSIKDPSFLKDLNKKELEALCDGLRKEILKQISTYGGHLSSNLGDVELTVAIHRSFDLPKDKLIFDVGHQCYAHKLLTGRSLEHLNEPDYPKGFPESEESPYDQYSGGHSSTSISIAEGYALARDLKGEKYEVIALIGDSSIANGLAFEGLNDLIGRKTKVIIILNDNDMAISAANGGLSKVFRKLSTGKAYNKFKRGYVSLLRKTKGGTTLYNWSLATKNWIKRHLLQMNIFDNLGFTYIGVVDGHDIHAMEKAFKKAKNSTKSVVVHVSTTKGKGYKYAEKDATGYWHGVTPFDLETGAPKNVHPGSVSFSHFFSDYTAKIMENNPNTFLIVPAMLRGAGLEGPYTRYKDRAIDVGIQEEHALTLAGGLALSDIHPIVSIYSSFLQRAYDELSHDCARFNSNMTIIVERAGLLGLNADTHQGLYDVAYLKSIPGVVVTLPADFRIAAGLYEESLKGHGVFAIRCPREVRPYNPEEGAIETPFMEHRFLKRSETSRLALVVTGPVSSDIAELLKDVDCDIIDPIYLNPLGESLLSYLLNKDRILLYDAYSIKEGFVDTVLSALMEKGYRGEVKYRCVPTVYIYSDKIEKQRLAYGIAPSQVAELARKMAKE